MFKVWMAAACLLAAEVLAPVSPARAQTDADWAARPGREELAAVLPAGARALGGRVILRCKADQWGRLSGCALVADSSGAPGVVQAVMSLIPKYQIKPQRVAAVAPGGQVMIVESWFEADTQPKWRHSPTLDELRGVWPADAWRHGRDGRATINCLTTASGNLHDCVAVSDSPAGQQFGGAAVALAPQLPVSPATIHGRPVDGVFETSIVFPSVGDMSSFVVTQSVVPPATSWGEAPGIADVASLYPAKARADRVGGFASVQCSFSDDGRTKNCRLLREEPMRRGFGDAAKALAARFRLDPASSKTLRFDHASAILPFTFDPDLVEAKTAARAVWTRTPDAAALRAALGARPTSSQSGRAVLSCEVRQGGGLQSCSVVSETPSGGGLGQTVLALQDGFRAATWTDQGLPVVGSRIRVPMQFDLDPPPKP